MLELRTRTANEPDMSDGLLRTIVLRILLCAVVKSMNSVELASVNLLTTRSDSMSGRRTVDRYSRSGLASMPPSVSPRRLHKSDTASDE